jgi:hypothetical protein
MKDSNPTGAEPPSESDAASTGEQSVTNAEPRPAERAFDEATLASEGASGPAPAGPGLALSASHVSSTLGRSRAQRDFDRAHQRAFIQDALSFLRREPPNLLPFETVRERLELGEKTYLGVRFIRLDQIVGSVGRYRDFTRTFLPRAEHMRRRWQEAEEITSARGLSPVQVYQVGKVYFVIDGNHRVSVARQIGAETIPAHVWEFETRVPLEPDDAVDDVLIRHEYLGFLERTRLEVHRPEQYIIPTSPGRYRYFEEQIAVHRHYLELDRGCNVPFEEAAVDWYDNVYLPIVDVIHREEMLRLFPGRTEADLVNWIMRNQARLRQRYGAEGVSTESVAEEVANRAHGNLWQRFVSWFRRVVLRWPVYTGEPWKPDTEIR